MPQAGASNSRVAPEPPPVDVINATLDPGGSAVQCGLERMYGLEEIANFRTVFIARHLVAAEIERLIDLLDVLSGDDDIELSVSNLADDPRLDDAEADGADDEPSLAGFDGRPIYYGMADLEGDPAESGIADLDGLAEQIGRAA